MRASALARPLALVLVTALLVRCARAGPRARARRGRPGSRPRGRDPPGRRGDFEGAVATLGPVADRLAAKGGHDAAQACLYLGIAHLALDQRDAARARFREALGHEPSLRLGPDRFSPKVIAAFEDARREREAAARAAAPGDEAGAEARATPAERLLAGGRRGRGRSERSSTRWARATPTRRRRAGHLHRGALRDPGARLSERHDGDAARRRHRPDRAERHRERRDDRRGLRRPHHRRLAGGAERGRLREHTQPATVAPTTLRPGHDQPCACRRPSPARTARATRPASTSGGAASPSPPAPRRPSRRPTRCVSTCPSRLGLLVPTRGVHRRSRRRDPLVSARGERDAGRESNGQSEPHGCLLDPSPALTGRR